MCGSVTAFAAAELSASECGDVSKQVCGFFCVYGVCSPAHPFACVRCRGGASYVNGVVLFAGGARALCWDQALFDASRGALTLWDVANGSKIRALPGHASRLRGVVLLGTQSAGGNPSWLLSWSEDSVQLWDLKTIDSADWVRCGSPHPLLFG